MPDHLALIDEHEHRDALNAEALRDHRRAVHVHFDHLQLALITGRHSFDDRRELFAGLAPIRIEIDEDRDIAAKDLLLKIRVAYFDDRHSSNLAESAAPLHFQRQRAGSERFNAALSLAIYV